MNNCSWYLWLSGKKIYNIRQLRENFDTALLTGYFLGGSLMKWLSDLGESGIMKRLSDIDTSADIGRQLEFAFGVSPDKKPEQPSMPSPPPEITVTPEQIGTAEIAVYAGSSFSGAAISSFTGLAESSFAALIGNSFAGIENFISSFAASESFISSFTALSESSFASIVGNAFAAKFTSSYNFSSYTAFVSGQALNIQSSAINSSLGSFMSLFGARLYGIQLGGSFSLSSFMSGSFSYYFGKYGQFTSGAYGSLFYGSFGLLLRMLLARAGGSLAGGSYGSFGNINMFFGEGSFRYSETGMVITADEYHRTLINLSSCPLNAYGYGINLV